jgi:hypothetical protein
MLKYALREGLPYEELSNYFMCYGLGG